jgi:hypothetical protein
MFATTTVTTANQGMNHMNEKKEVRDEALLFQTRWIPSSIPSTTTSIASCPDEVRYFGPADLHVGLSHKLQQKGWDCVYTHMDTSVAKTTNGTGNLGNNKTTGISNAKNKKLINVMIVSNHKKGKWFTLLLTSISKM